MLDAEISISHICTLNRDMDGLVGKSVAEAVTLVRPRLYADEEDCDARTDMRNAATTEGYIIGRVTSAALNTIPGLIYSA
eukprot:7228574-Heterocapsa_arctica.AAC.1